MKNVFSCFLTLWGCFFFAPLLAQTSEFAKQVFSEMNLARTQPQVFLQKHKTVLEEDFEEDDYIAFLQKAKPHPPLEWDPALEAMARSVIEQNNLNPQYKGKNKQCGIAAGSKSGREWDEPMYYILELYTNLHNPDYVYIGMYFKPDKKSYAYQMAQTCTPQKVKYHFSETIDTSAVNFAQLNTAKNAPYMTEIEKRMVVEINFVRAYPKIYAKLVKKYLSDESQSPFGLSNSDYETGLELIAELEKMEPRSILQPMECVYLAAKKHGIDCQKRGFFDHSGSDGSNPWDRIKRECKNMTGNENGAGNTNLNPRNPVISLLIDEGIPGRGHRRNLLDEQWVYVACYRYVGQITEYYTFYEWVQNFAKND